MEEILTKGIGTLAMILLKDPPSDSHGQNFAGHVVLGLADYLGGIGRLCPSSADRMVCMRKRSWN